AVTRRSAGQEVRSRVLDGGPRGGDTRREVQRAGERYESRAAASSASKSGTSDVPYRHAPRTVPSASTRNAVRSATSAKPRNSCAIPNAFTASAFQSESRGKFKSRACDHEMCVQGESRDAPKTRTSASANSALLSRRSSISFVQVDDQSKR